MEAWMHDREKALITKHLTKDKVMLEWGSGGSTIEFSKQVKDYYSIEHNKEWYDKVKNELNNQQITNVNYNYIPETQQRPANSGQSEYYQYKDYLDVVDTFDTKFDVVLIDGRARRLCAKKIIPYLNPGAIIIIHDWVLRHVYHCVTDYYDVLEYVSDTPQTIATFTLKDKPKPNAYDLNLSGWERCTENYFHKNNSMKISLIQPSRNNLKYLKWSYDSIRKNQGDHEVEICVADDFSDKDGTWEWCQEMMKKDPHFKAIRNEGPTRLGHTILYDRLVNEVATHELCMIYHADMYLCPGALDAIQKHMYTVTDLTPKNHPTGYEIVDGKKIEYGVKVEENEKTIVSLTRIEPPLHPPGPEKVLLDCGIEPEEFDETKLLSEVTSMWEKGHKQTTEGIFAPWAFWKKDFQEIGGHDELFAPQSKEDTDIFNRFHLNGIKFVQTWEGFVYHMTCRGSRFADGAKRNPDGQVFMKNRETDEWLAQNLKSTREFIRKWGHFCKHDQYLKPIVPPKYDIGIIVKNSRDVQLIEALEPWCSTIYVDDSRTKYITLEQPNTSFNLSERVLPYDNEKNNEILVEIDGKTFNQQDYQYITQLAEILATDDQLEAGEFSLGNLRITISQMHTYEKDLICNTTS